MPLELEDDLEVSDEAKKVRWHRYRTALAVGLSEADAFEFADKGTDSHALTDLIDRGCPPTTALRIVL